MYRARRGENYTAEELQLATVGAFTDEYRHEKGYYGHISVLRPKKVHDLIERGRRGGEKPVSGWGAWAKQHFPDFDANRQAAAAMRAGLLANGNNTVDASAIRAEILARFPIEAAA
jgi:hypothetical protein